MDMAGNHSDSPSWRAWDLHIPQSAWKIFEKKLSHPVIGSPGGQYVLVEIA
jgi:hypothetical protein